MNKFTCILVVSTTEIHDEIVHSTVQCLAEVYCVKSLS